jgi:hypothetical protein
MIHSTLYLPGKSPQVVSLPDISTPVVINGFADVPEQVPALLDCAPELVDVLAIGKGYVVYSVFDCEAGVNPTAMQALADLTGMDFDIENEDEVLRGPILVMAA